LSHGAINLGTQPLRGFGDEKIAEEPRTEISTDGFIAGMTPSRSGNFLSLELRCAPGWMQEWSNRALERQGRETRQALWQTGVSISARRGPAA
jgi:hypothetical protein